MDGTRVFYEVESSQNQNHLWSASRNGGDERPVSGVPIDILEWAPAPGGIYFINGSTRHFSLNYYDFLTQHVQKTADLPSFAFMGGRFTISHDGHTVLLAGSERAESDIMLVEGFR